MLPRPESARRDARRGWALRALALVSLAAFPCSTAAAQLSVDELELFLKPGRSGPRTALLRVTNESDRPVQAQLELQDWDRDEAGGNRFHALGSQGRSCGDRIKVTPGTLRLEPRRSETVRVTYEGADTTANCWTILFVQGDQAAQRMQRSGLTYVVRTGVKVYLEPANLPREAAIEDARHVARREPVAPGRTDSTLVRYAEVLFHNTGESHLRTKGTLEIRRADNSLVRTVPFEEFPTTPGARRRVAVRLPADLAHGDYVGLVLLDFGGIEIAAAQLELPAR